MAVIPGTGATVKFDGTTIALGILSISLGGMSRPAIDITTLASGSERDAMAGNLVDPGELVLELLLDAEIGTAATAPEFLDTASGAVIITMPGAGNDTITAAGICTGLDMSIPLEDRMTATMTIKLHGNTAFNAI